MKCCYYAIDFPDCLMLLLIYNKLYANGNLKCTILLHRSSIRTERDWYLLACFRIEDGIFDKSPLPKFSRFTNSSSSTFSLFGTPDDARPIFQGDSLKINQNEQILD